VQSLTAILGCAGAVLGLLLLARSRPALTETTLTIPWIWSVVALLSLACLNLGELPLLGLSPAALSHGRYAAAVLSFMPLMAVLGASRPRDRGWHVVTFGLLVILLLPSAESWLYRPGQRLVIEGARAWFLVILVGLGPVNYGATRFRASSLAMAAAQVLLLEKLLPWPASLKGAVVWGNLGAGFATPLVLVAIWLARRPTAPASRKLEMPLDRVWLGFRDAYGMLWGLRVVERMGASARMYHWPVTLHWSGFSPTDEPGSEAPLDPQTAAQMAAVFNNLLLRFVSEEWIAERKRAP